MEGPTFGDHLLCAHGLLADRVERIDPPINRMQRDGYIDVLVYCEPVPPPINQVRPRRLLGGATGRAVLAARRLAKVRPRPRPCWLYSPWDTVSSPRDLYRLEYCNDIKPLEGDNDRM